MRPPELPKTLWGKRAQQSCLLRTYASPYDTPDAPRSRIVDEATGGGDLSWDDARTTLSHGGGDPQA